MIAASIKRLTAGIHVEAEGAVRAFAPFDSIDRYADYLDRLFAFYDAIEPRLVMALDGVVEDAASRFIKREAVRADLVWLGRAQRIASTAIRVPPMTSIASALGVAYVLEGKTLGARFLLAEARTSLDLDVSRGATFLSGYGAHTGSMWNGYRATLEGWVATHGRRAAVVRGARATFDSFIACVSSSSASLRPHRAASSGDRRRPPVSTASS